MRFRFRTPVHKLREKAAARFKLVSRDEVFQWAETAMAGSWKALEDARKADKAEVLEVSLEELERGLQQVLGAVDDLRRRGL